MPFSTKIIIPFQYSLYSCKELRNMNSLPIIIENTKLFLSNPLNFNHVQSTYHTELEAFGHQTLQGEVRGKKYFAIKQLSHFACQAVAVVQIKRGFSNITVARVTSCKICCNLIQYYRGQQFKKKIVFELAIMVVWDKF